MTESLSEQARRRITTALGADPAALFSEMRAGTARHPMVPLVLHQFVRLVTAERDQHSARRNLGQAAGDDSVDNLTARIQILAEHTRTAEHLAGAMHELLSAASGRMPQVTSEQMRSALSQIGLGLPSATNVTPNRSAPLSVPAPAPAFKHGIPPLTDPQRTALVKIADGGAAEKGLSGSRSRVRAADRTVLDRDAVSELQRLGLVTVGTADASRILGLRNAPLAVTDQGKHIAAQLVAEARRHGATTARTQLTPPNSPESPVLPRQITESGQAQQRRRGR
ncbi:hypothetical protein [Mangrovactinospora gilvigrisea]|uniref:hypothetical protein n=1 Tax=Mangrovactinospora gilvigrisea TaxID=1428644 RepID=UPI000A776907|nr:hypothetical protein [Mangrovactinospora gilvigrisea]